jgi:hypothetical protein
MNNMCAPIPQTLNHRLQLTNLGLHRRLNFINSISWLQSTRLHFMHPEPPTDSTYIDSIFMNSKAPQTPFHKFHFMNSECARLFPFHGFKAPQTHHHFMNSEHNRLSSWRPRERERALGTVNFITKRPTPYSCKNIASIKLQSHLSHKTCRRSLTWNLRSHTLLLTA